MLFAESAWGTAHVPCLGAGVLGGEARFVALLKLGVGKKYFDDETLRAVADSGEPLNPVDLGCACSQSEALAHRKAFAGAIADGGWTTVRAAAREMLAAREGENARRDTARGETWALPVPKVARVLPEALAPVSGNRSKAFTHRGKHYLAVTTEKSVGVAVLDIETLESVAIPYPGRYDGLSTVSFFERNGNPFFAYHVRGRLGEMDVHARTNHPDAIPWMAAAEGRELMEQMVYSLGGKTYSAVVATRANHESPRLIVVPLSHPAESTVHFDIDIDQATLFFSGAGAPRIVNVDTRRDALTFYDPHTLATIRAVPVPAGLGAGIARRDLVSYENAKGARAAVPASDGIAIFDPVEGKYLHTIASQTGMQNDLSLHGDMLVLGGSETVSVIDRDTEIVRHTFAAPTRKSPVASFALRGQRFLAWGDENGNLTIADPRHGLVVTSLKVATEKIREVATFEREGRPQALVMTDEKPPILVHLSRER